jgi:NAD(P) transhydrogenase subunit beta
VACAKLQGILPGAPLTYKGQNIFNLSLLAITVLCFILLLVFPGHAELFYLMLFLSFVFGVLLVLPIGAADMPVVIALLNAYAGLASAATGMVIGNNVLIIAGMLDGGSGFILSIVMCKAMNRSITNVLFGAFGSVSETVSASDGEMQATNIEDVAVLLAYARQAVFVPGYGMATAQAQHVLRQLADALEERGVTVKYAIHPVAGRMPGHMNVLLAEANVPYSQLQELEVINPEFPATDVAVVIGANDVVNPDARDNPKSIIAGMPILEVDRAKKVVVLKRGQGKGFSGLVNPLFFKPNCDMLYGDAKESLTNLVQAVHTA